jgi:hypothetical protein
MTRLATTAIVKSADTRFNLDFDKFILQIFVYRRQGNILPDSSCISNFYSLSVNWRVVAMMAQSGEQW